MYNGIGLTTPRGSGTNGHVQRNWAVVRPREKDRSYRTEDELASLDCASNKQPNKDILDHERKRKIELKCAEFADILEEQGYGEGVITNKVNNYRNMLLNHDGRVDKAVDQWGRPSVTETHQVAEAQQEKNAKLRQAFGISEYFVDGSSFDPDREAKEQVARSNAHLERERQQQLDRAQAQRYQLVQTPSPEPEEKQTLAPDEAKKNKKRKHKDSSSSEEASSSKKKKKSKKRNKKERSEKSKDKKTKKKRKHSSKTSSDDSDDTGASSNEDSTSDEDRKRKKRKKKEKKKLKKKHASSKSSESSRDSSPETRKQKLQTPKLPGKNDCKHTSSKTDYRRHNSHEREHKRYSESPSVQRDRGRVRDRQSPGKDNRKNWNQKSYNSRKQRSPQEEKPQNHSPRRNEKPDARYRPNTKNVRSRSLSSEHERGKRPRKYELNERQHRSRSRDGRSRSRSPKSNKRLTDNRCRSRSKSGGRRSRSHSANKVKQIKASAKKIRSKSKSIERPSRQKSRRSYSRSPEVLRSRHIDSKRSRSRDARNKRISPKLPEKFNLNISISPEIVRKRTPSISPRNDKHYYKKSVSQDRNKHISKLPARHRSKSIERKPEYTRSRHTSTSSFKIQPQKSSPSYERIKRSVSPKQNINKQQPVEDTYNKNNTKRAREEEILKRSSSTVAVRRSTSTEERHHSGDQKSTKYSSDKCSPREVSNSPQRKSSLKKEVQNKNELIVEILTKINDDSNIKSKNCKRAVSLNDRHSKETSSSPDENDSNRCDITKQRTLMEHVLSNINDHNSQVETTVSQVLCAKSSKDRSQSPDLKLSKRIEADKHKFLMEQVLSKINGDNGDSNDVKQIERSNRNRTPSLESKSIKHKSLMEEVISKINNVSQSLRSTTPPRNSRFSETEKQQKKTPKSSTKSREQKPVVCLRSTSDDENSNSGNEHEENAEHIENEMRVLRMLKTGLAAKAKESLERKRISKKRTPSPTKKAIDPNTFDIQGPALVERREAVLQKISSQSTQLFQSYESLVKEVRKDGSVKEFAASSPPAKKSKDKERKSRSCSVESQSVSRSSKNSKSKERKSRSSSKTKKKDRRSVSSSSTSSYSSGHRSLSSSSSSTDSSQSSISRSRSSSGSRSSSSSSRSRSPSIPRRHGSPSFLDRRRITRR